MLLFCYNDSIEKGIYIMKKFASYTVEFNGCNHMLNFDFCIGYDVVSDSEIIVNAWHDENEDLLEGVFSIKGLQHSFNSNDDHLDIVQFLLNQYCM